MSWWTALFHPICKQETSDLFKAILLITHRTRARTQGHWFATRGDHSALACINLLWVCQHRYVRLRKLLCNAQHSHISIQPSYLQPHQPQHICQHCFHSWVLGVTTQSACSALKVSQGWGCNSAVEPFPTYTSPSVPSSAPGEEPRISQLPQTTTSPLHLQSVAIHSLLVLLLHFLRFRSKVCPKRLCAQRWGFGKVIRSWGTSLNLINGWIMD